jgi:hypothetical protein
MRHVVVLLGCVVSLSIRAGAGPPPTANVELLVVVDNEQFVLHGHDTNAWALERLTATAGVFANSSSSPFLLSVVDIVVFDQGDPYSVTPDVNGEVDGLTLLAEFSGWLAIQSLAGHDAAILLSGYDFVGATFSFAFTAGACATATKAGVVSTLSSLAFDRAATARTLGRLLGACNDPPAPRGFSCLDLSTVPGLDPESCGGFVMGGAYNPASPPSAFSPCSGADFQAWLQTAAAACVDYGLVFRDDFESGNLAAWNPLSAASRQD